MIGDLIKELTFAQNIIDNYEQQVKLDKIAMLKELQSEVDKAEWHNHNDYIEESFNNGVHKVGELIQQKINELSENNEENNGEQ